MRQPESGVSTSTEQVLRVGVVANTEVIEVARLRRRGRVTIGRARANDIVVDDPNAPRRMTLLRLGRRGCALSTAEALDGNVWLDRAGVTLSMDEFRAALLHPGRHHLRVLDEHSLGLLEAWGRRVLFQLVDLPKLPPAQRATSLRARTLAPTALLAATLAIGALIALVTSQRPRAALDEQARAPAGTHITVTPLAAPPPTVAVGEQCTGEEIAAAPMSLAMPDFDGTPGEWEGLRPPPGEEAASIAPPAIESPRIAAPQPPRALEIGRVALRTRSLEHAPPSLAGEEFIPDGLLSPEAAVREIERRRGAVTAEFERALRRDPRLSGGLDVRFTVDDRGDVIAVRILGDSVGDRALRREVRRTLGTWRFPAPARGPVSFSFRFVFKAAKRPRVS